MYDVWLQQLCFEESIVSSCRDHGFPYFLGRLNERQSGQLNNCVRATRMPVSEAPSCLGGECNVRVDHTLVVRNFRQH